MSANLPSDGPRELNLQVYLLGQLEFDAYLSFQRRLHYDITGDRANAALVLCEHPPLITVGRQGSRSHLRAEGDGRWPIRWVPRGGGCVLHTPGQLAVYPILPLDRLGLKVPDYLRQLGATIADVVSDYSIRAPIHTDESGVRIGNHPLAALGVSVRDWVTGFGAYVNLNPPLDCFRSAIASSSDGVATSLQRERRGAIRSSLVREKLIEHFQRRFPIARLSLFSDHPALHGLTQRCADQPILEDA